MLHNPFGANENELDADKLMLINMAADSTEYVNGGAKHPEIVQRLLKQYKSWINEVAEQE